MTALRVTKALGGVLASAVCIAAAVLLSASPINASAEKVPPTTEREAPAGSEAPDCPTVNPPNRLELVSGTLQTTAIGTDFPASLQVMLSNTNGCAVTGAAGTPVTFSAPASGASSTFSGAGTNAVTVGSDSSGLVVAPALVANEIAGTYQVSAGSSYGSLSFQLTNSAAGVPAQIVAISPAHSSAKVSSRYARPLRVKVLDRSGKAVAGAAVTFAVGTAATRLCAERTPAGASFATGAGESATTTTGARGIATSPPLTANRSIGTFGATVSVSGSSGGGEFPEAGESEDLAGGAVAEPAAGTAGPPTAHFRLTNLAGAPATVEAGVGSRQSARAGSRFGVPLAVTVLDGDGNRVPGTRVTFAAPRSEPGGRFLVPRGDRRLGARAARRVVDVRTDDCGIAVAPAFLAGRRPGGYGVRARAGHGRLAVFALVNEPR